MNRFNLLRGKCKGEESPPPEQDAFLMYDSLEIGGIAMSRNLNINLASGYAHFVWGVHLEPFAGAYEAKPSIWRQIRYKCTKIPITCFLY